MDEKVEVIKKEVSEEIKDVLEINVEELVEGNSIFESQGYSKIKVTHKGVVKILKIPIKSSGVSSLIDEIRKDKPQPPVVNIVIKPGDPAFKELRLTKKQHVKTFDLTDENYLNELENHNTNLGLKIVLQGLDITLKDKDGNTVTDDNKKIEILKGMGITGSQFSQLVDDITALTQWEEEKEADFLE